MSQTTSEIVWIDDLLQELNFLVARPIDLSSDNKFAIHLAHNPIFQERTKLLKIDYHYKRDHIQNGVIIVLHVKSFL